MLKVFNTLSKQKEEFEPLNPPFVSIYVCGPTVYDDPHLGHAKSYISFDVIVRFLRSQGYKVRYVQNITDVGHLLGESDDGEDRVQKKARLEQLEPIEIAQKYENHFFRDMDRLNNKRPDISCRATGHVIEMIQLIETLIRKGYAYEAEGNVYFDLTKFKDYGKLSGRKVEDLLEGVRVDVAAGKRHPSDFALWKKADPEHLMQWPSPWSTGYPGWHLECSVMSMKYLGESIDIHGGGLDNQFPHHECEIAQSEAATGRQFVKYWLHNNMVTVRGTKMSKSLGNFSTIETLLNVYHPMALRMFVLQGHYRSPQDISDEALGAAQKGFEKLSAVSQTLSEKTGAFEASVNLTGIWADYRKKFIQFMEDDFNTAGAIAILFNMVKSVHDLLYKESERDQLQQASSLFHELSGDILGFTFEAQTSVATKKNRESELIEFIAEMRQSFREQKDWASADRIRDFLSSLGVQLEDSAQGTRIKS